MLIFILVSVFTRKIALDELMFPSSYNNPEKEFSLFKYGGVFGTRFGYVMPW